MKWIHRDYLFDAPFHALLLPISSSLWVPLPSPYVTECIGRGKMVIAQNRQRSKRSRLLTHTYHSCGNCLFFVVIQVIEFDGIVKKAHLQKQWGVANRLCWADEHLFSPSKYIHIQCKRIPKIRLFWIVSMSLPSKAGLVSTKSTDRQSESALHRINYGHLNQSSIRFAQMNAMKFRNNVMWTRICYHHHHHHDGTIVCWVNTVDVIAGPVMLALYGLNYFAVAVHSNAKISLHRKTN